MDNISKKERKALRRQEKSDAHDALIRKKRTGKIVPWISWGAFGAITIAGIAWLIAAQPPIPESDIVSRNGLHWHAQLAIYVKGVQQEIPANIGMLGNEMPVHTHDATGEIHLEMSGLVRKTDITLGRFFKVWGKDMNSFGAKVEMTVNGKENTDYENYLMQDKDNIELHYE